jgi:hypothetical protein
MRSNIFFKKYFKEQHDGQRNIIVKWYKMDNDDDVEVVYNMD